MIGEAVVRIEAVGAARVLAGFVADLEGLHLLVVEHFEGDVGEAHDLEGNVRDDIPVVHDAEPLGQPGIDEFGGMLVTNSWRSKVVEFSDLTELELKLDSTEGRKSSSEALARHRNLSSRVFGQKIVHVFLRLVSYGLPSREEPAVHFTVPAPDVRDLLVSEILDPVASIDGTAPAHNDAVDALVVAREAVNIGLVVVDDDHLSKTVMYVDQLITLLAFSTGPTND